MERLCCFVFKIIINTFVPLPLPLVTLLIYNVLLSTGSHHTQCCSYALLLFLLSSKEMRILSKVRCTGAIRFCCMDCEH